MLHYDRIDVPEGIDVKKSNESYKCFICSYYYFPKINFRFHLEICDACHDLIQKVMSFNNVAIVSTKGNGNRIHLWYMIKNEAINIMKKSF